MGKAEERRLAMSTLLNAMVKNGNKDFGPVLTGIGKRFLATPEGERGSIFSTAAVNTDFMDSIPMRGISRSSDFSLADLRSGQPTTVYLCIPEGRLGSHYRWLRMIVQLACLVLEEMGPALRDGRPPVLLMLDEFASLGRMPVMERAAAYLPGFGVKLWAALQDIKQLHPYGDAAETFLGNAGLVQCWANTDPATVEYIAKRLDKLMMPFEVAQTFARENNNQLLMFAGKQPAAAMRLSHDDVAEVKERSTELAWALERERSKGRR
jgi:type IV secretion system protein VirD4